MARGDAYATGAEYIDAKKGLASSTPALEAQLKAVTAVIDKSLNRRAGFWQDTTPQIRTFRRTLPSLIITDDFSPGDAFAIRHSGVYVADWNTLTPIDVSYYEFGPFNADLEGKPFDRIYGYNYSFSDRVQISALWGYPPDPETDGPPAAIKIATIELTALVRVEGQRSLRQTSLDVGTLIGTSRDAQSILGDLKNAYWRPD